MSIKLSLTPLYGEEPMKVQAKAKKEMDRVLYETLGFTHIWNLLKEYKPLLIGHNCLLDILFMFSHFDDELPESFREWRNTYY